MKKRGSAGVFRMQLARMLTRMEFRYACLLSFIFIAAAFFEECTFFWGTDRSELLSAAYGWGGNVPALQSNVFQAFYLFAISLIAALPFADSFLEDRKCHSLAPILGRTTWGTYRRAGIFLSFIGGFFVIFVPLLVSQLLSFLLFPATGVKFDKFSAEGAWALPAYRVEAYLFPSILLNCPYVHNLVFICYSSLFAGMNAVASYLLSLLGVQKKLLVLGLPTVFWLIYNVVITFIRPDMLFQIYLYPDDVVTKQLWFFFALPLCMLAVLLLGAAVAKRRRMEAALQ